MSAARSAKNGYVGTRCSTKASYASCRSELSLASRRVRDGRDGQQRGRRWTDTKEQVAEGLAAARVANRLNEELIGLAAPKVEAVDVAGFPATPRSRMKGEVVLMLSDGRTVQWGRTERDLTGVTREDPYDVKRDRLLDLLATRPVTDRRPLDVRFPAGLRDVGLRSDG